MRPAYFGIFIMLFVSIAVCAHAAQLEPSFDRFLDQASPDTHLSVIVILPSPRDIQALDQVLHHRRAPLAERKRTVIAALRANAEETQGYVIERLNQWKSSGQVDGYTAYWIENLIVVKGAVRIINELKSDPAVSSVEPNFSARLMEPVVRGPIRAVHFSNLDEEQTTPGQNATGATRVNRELGITGQGVLVANCDTGVDWDHPAFGTRFRGRHAPMTQCWLDLIGNSPSPYDGAGHGSHVMGTICGREIQSDGDTITVGAAPNAEFICTNPVAQNLGPGLNNDVITAYQWFVDPDGDPNTLEDDPDVIQNSWGVYSWYPDYGECYSFWNTVIVNCEATGTIVIWSAGNDGTAAGTMGIPPVFAFTPTQIFSVGAIDATNFPAPFPIAFFSSCGPSDCPPNVGAIKPEVVAPGVDVLSVLANSTGYTQDFSGTSMSGPHVAGVAALMREACPDCDPQTIKELMLETATDEGYPPAGEDNTFGAGLVNAYDAVLAALAQGLSGFVDGFITDGNQAPLSGVRVRALDAHPFANSNANGYYMLRAAEGTHTIEYSKFGYATVIVPDVQTFELDTTHVNVTLSSMPTGVLQGLVQMQSGVPIANATVLILSTPLDTFLTDSEGNFTVTLPSDTYQVHAEFILNFPEPGIYSTDTVLFVNAGDTTHVVITVTVPFIEPTAPDAYGYRAYDRYDRGYPAPHEWVELDPAQGGLGTPFDYSHHDSSVFLATPFPLMFYGTPYDSMTVNNNGWLLPGVHHGAGRINYWIPFVVDEEPGIIAPYWDDFRRGIDAQQWYWYDANSGLWILEFVNQQLASPSTNLLSWQVHFLNPSAHPTVTGDGDIIFVYRRIEYVLNCTVGIENPAETTGIQILYNTNMNANSFPIDSTAAIRFTTGPLGGGSIASRTPAPKEFSLEQNYPNPFNSTTRIRLAIPEAGHAQLRIYDINGRLVRTLQTGMIAPGNHEFTWDSRDETGSQIASGVYFCRFAAERYASTRKMLFVK
jgi:subtilisin family serine protease